jgi:pyridoxamine 5'-phosphate oxidase
MDERDLDPDPIVALAAWLRDAEGVSTRPDAMTLATATTDGRPSARVVLLRGLDERGLAFFTNRASRKGRELEENPSAALVLHWPELGRQVRVEGAVERVGDAESHAYWRTRPLGSRIAAWASPQSRPLADRAELDALYAAAAARFGAGDVPLPDFWGGYRVVPASIEFWEHQDDRLHDRIRYERTADALRARHASPLRRRS